MDYFSPNEKYWNKDIQQFAKNFSTYDVDYNPYQTTKFWTGQNSKYLQTTKCYVT